MKPGEAPLSDKGDLPGFSVGDSLGEGYDVAGTDHGLEH